MKLLIFAHTPPPVHGQSVMVKMLLDHLPGHPGFELSHVNARLSQGSADIGRWRLGKVFALFRACVSAWRLRLKNGPAYLYYVPAPGKRSALYRDVFVMFLCRPFFSGLILHWHAVGLGDWLHRKGTPLERWLARRALGRAALSLVLAPSLAADAQALDPQRVAIVPNAVPDPAPAPRRATGPTTPCRLLYVGLCSHEKGLFDLMAALALLAPRHPGRFQLTIAGGFESAQDDRELRMRLAALPAGMAEYVGFADEARKRTLFAQADVFCFPTRYPHEGQPLTLIEALAHDLRIVSTRWRAIPEMLPAGTAWLVLPAQLDPLTKALIAAADAPASPGLSRQHYLAHFTPAHHRDALIAALRSLTVPPTTDKPLPTVPPPSPPYTAPNPPA